MNLCVNYYNTMEEVLMFVNAGEIKPVSIFPYRDKIAVLYWRVGK